MISDLNASDLSQAAVQRLLFRVEDDGTDGDVIVVFGSRTALNYRVPHAVGLYTAGRAPLILFTGGATWGDGRPEAVVMHEAAKVAGVPPEATLIEARSTNTHENIVASRDLVARTVGLDHVGRLLLVTTTFHMRRCLLTAATYFPSGTRFSACPVDDKTTRADNWWANDLGRRLAIAEAQKLVQYVQDGSIRDAPV